MARTLDRFQGRREEDNLLLTGSTSLPSTSGEITYLTSSVSGSGFFFNHSGTIKTLGIQNPLNATTGSLLCYDGNVWTHLSAGISGYSLVSNGPNTIPSWTLIETYPLVINYTSFTGSNVFGSNSEDTHIFTGSVIAVNGITGSLHGTSSYASDSDKLDGLHAAAFAILTASNVFTADQTITGSLSATNGITGSLFGTASFASQALTSSFASNSNLLDGLDSTEFIKTNSQNTFNGDQTINGNVTINGTASVNVFVTNYQTSSIIYTSGSTKFGNSSDDTHQFTGSIRIDGSITGSLFGTASFASNTDLLDGFDSSYFATSASFYELSSSVSTDINLLNKKVSNISLTLDGVVSGSYSTLIGSFFVQSSSVYTTSSFVYFGGSQGTELAYFEIKNQSSPTPVFSINKSTTLSISYLTSSISLTSGLYNIYLYSNGSGTAIAKNLYLTTI